MGDGGAGAATMEGGVGAGGYEDGFVYGRGEGDGGGGGVGGGVGRREEGWHSRYHSSGVESVEDMAGMMARDDVQAATLLLLGLKSYGQRLKMEGLEEEDCLSGSAATETGSEGHLSRAKVVEHGRSATMMTTLASTAGRFAGHTAARVKREEMDIEEVEDDGLRAEDGDEEDDVEDDEDDDDEDENEEEDDDDDGAAEAEEGAEEEDDDMDEDDGAHASLLRIKGESRELSPAPDVDLQEVGPRDNPRTSTSASTLAPKKQKKRASKDREASMQKKTRRKTQESSEAATTKPTLSPKPKKPRSREESRQALAPNTSVACKVRDSESGDQQWILGTVVQYISESKKYEVLDVGESDEANMEDEEDPTDPNARMKKYYKVVRSKLRVLPAKPRLDLAVAERALAVYPNTTVFYPATVRVMASDRKDREYMLEFDDEEEEEGEDEDVGSRMRMDGDRSSRQEDGVLGPHAAWKKVPAEYVLPLESF